MKADKGRVGSTPGLTHSCPSQEGRRLLHLFYDLVCPGNLHRFDLI